MMKLYKRILASSASIPLPMQSWRSGVVGSVPKVGADLPSGNPTYFNSFGCQPIILRKHNGALYLIGYYYDSVMHFALFKSTDDGLTWTVLNSNLFQGANISDLIITSSGRLILTTYLSFNAYYSDNEGATWTYTSANTNNISSLASADVHNNTVMVVGSKSNYATQQHVSISYDGGLTWNAKQVSATGLEQIRIAYGNGMWLIYTMFGVVIRSMDDGQTWERLTPVGLPPNKNRLKFLNNKFFLFDNGDETKISYSTDGITWTTMPVPSGISSVDEMDYDTATDSYVFVGTVANKASQYIGVIPGDMTSIVKYGYPPELQADANLQSLARLIASNGKIVIMTNPASKCFISP